MDSDNENIDEIKKTPENTENPDTRAFDYSLLDNQTNEINNNINFNQIEIEEEIDKVELENLDGINILKKYSDLESLNDFSNDFYTENKIKIMCIKLKNSISLENLNSFGTNIILLNPFTNMLVNLSIFF